MALSFTYGTPTLLNSGAGSSTVTAPACSAGDLLLIVVAFGGGSPVLGGAGITGGFGATWTEVPGFPVGPSGSNTGLTVAQRPADATDSGATFTLNYSGSANKAIAWVVKVVDSGGGTPATGASAARTVAAATAMATSQITVAAGSLVLAVFTARDAAVTNTYTPAAWTGTATGLTGTERDDQCNTGSSQVSGELQDGAGAVGVGGTVTANTTSLASLAYCAGIIELTTGPFRLPSKPVPATAAARPGRTWLRRFHHRQALAPLVVLLSSSTIDGTRPVTATAAAVATNTKPVTATQPVTASRVAAVSNAKPATAAATITASRTAVLTVSKPVAATLPVTASRTATAVSGGISGTVAITANRTAAATVSKPIAAVTTVTASRAAAGTSAKAVAAALAVTANRAAALTRTRNAAAALAVTATRVAAGTSAKAIAAARAITANRTAAATDVPPGKNIDGTRAITAGRTAAVTVPRGAAAVTAVTANRTAAITIAKPVAAALTVTAARTAAESDTGSFTVGALTGTAMAASALTGTVAASQLTGAVAVSATLTSEIDRMGGPG